MNKGLIFTTIIFFIGITSIGLILATECDSENLDLCSNATACGNASGYWYENTCNSAETCVTNVDAQTCCLGDNCEGGPIDCEGNVSTIFGGCTDDCQPIQWCDLPTNPECTTDSECEAGYVCNEGVCDIIVINDCTKDSDCDEEYACDLGLCVLEEEEENNKTEVDKICCKRTMNREGKKTWSNYIDRESCIDSDTFTTEIIDDELCSQIREAIKEKNQIKFEGRTRQECVEGCTCNGRVMQCMLEGDREMIIYAGSGNVLIKVKGGNMTTNVSLYHHNGELYGNFKGKEKKIIDPEQIRERIQKKIKAKFLEEETKFELDEKGVYKFKSKKKAKLFWIIPVSEDIEAEIDAETGEFFKFKKGRWWGYLARDVEEETEE